MCLKTQLDTLFSFKYKIFKKIMNILHQHGVVGV